MDTQDPFCLFQRIFISTRLYRTALQALYMHRSGIDRMDPKPKRRVWEIDTLYGSEDIRFYFFFFALFLAAGILLTVIGILYMEMAGYYILSVLPPGIVFIFIGSIMLLDVYSKYRSLN